MSQKEYFKGAIEAFREFDRYLLPEEIQHIYQGELILLDKSGNGHHGMAINMTSDDFA